MKSRSLQQVKQSTHAQLIQFHAVELVRYTTARQSLNALGQRPATFKELALVCSLPHTDPGNSRRFEHA